MLEKHVLSPSVLLRVSTVEWSARFFWAPFLCSGTDLYVPRAKEGAAKPVDNGVLAILVMGGERAALFEHALIITENNQVIPVGCA